MPEPAVLPEDRLRPVLLDRLTDEEPSKREESRHARALTIPQLRAAVLRDLGWLLNTTYFESAQSLEDYPEVKTSVINYGIPELSGITASSINSRDLERQVRDAILRFEPRIIANTLRVRLAPPTEGQSMNGFQMEITGELWAEPLPERLFLRTSVDLDSGSIDVRDSDA